MSHLAFDFSTGIVYDSNVDLREDGEDDFYALARVGGKYWRRVSGHRLGIDAYVQHEEYAEQSEHSDTNFGFGIVFDPSIDRQDADFTYDLDIILRQENLDDEAAGRRVNTFTYGASGSVRYNPNRRWSVSGQSSYRNTDSDGAGLLDRERYGGGASFYYNFSPRLSLVTTANADHTTADRRDSTTPGLDQNDYWIYTLSTGLSGRILPKLTGSASVGAQYTAGDVMDQDWTPYASVSVSYAYDSTTAFTLNVSRSIVDTSTDLSTEATSITLRAVKQMRRDLSASIYTSYTIQELDAPAVELEPGSFVQRSREDEIYAIGASVNYQVAAWGSLIFDLRHQDKQSDLAGFDYDKFVASVRLSWSW